MYRIGEGGPVLPDFRKVASSHVKAFLAAKDIAKHVIRAHMTANRNWEAARRTLPCLITTIEDGPSNFVQGWGPANVTLAEEHVSEDGQMGRLPWIYRHDTKLTTAFEKFVFLLLKYAHNWLGSPGRSTLSAWGDLNPVEGIRAGDIEEIIEDEGLALLEPALLPSYASILANLRTSSED